MWQPSFEDWLEVGIYSGFCSPPHCTMHEGLPLTDEEEAVFEEGLDTCVPAVRIWFDVPVVPA